MIVGCAVTGCRGLKGAGRHRPSPVGRRASSGTGCPVRSSSSSIPDLSRKLVHRHRFAEATAALAAHSEAEAGREMTRRFVLPLLDVRGHALDAGTTPEVTDRHAHRLRRDSLVAPVLPHPPACFDFVGRDSLNAIARETQLSGTEEAVVPEVPDCPWSESVLSPLQLGGAGVTQRIVRVPRRSCVLRFVERGKGRQDQPCRPKSRRLLRRVSYGASLHALIIARTLGSFRNTGQARFPAPDR
jgi:hypothetical protein